MESSPRASPAVATLPWPSRRDEAFQNTRCLQCETEHLPDSVFCRICGSHRDGPQSSRQDRAPMQDEWYQTLMSRLRRLGDQASPRERQAGEPVTFAQSARPMRSASREALSVKLRELGLERPDIELCGGTERMDSARKVFFADTSMSTYEAQSRPARRMVILRPWQTLDERSSFSKRSARAKLSV
eukprot:g16874.t1